MNQLVSYSPPPAVKAAWQARGYPSLALQFHAEAIERRARMRGAIVEPDPPKPVWRDYEPPPPPMNSRQFYAEAHAIIDMLIANGGAIARPAWTPVKEIIKRTVTRVWGEASYEEMVGASRFRPCAVQRMVAMFVVRSLLPSESLPAIGRSFGGRDHTTVLHGLRKVAAMMDADPSFAARVGAAQEAAQFAILEYEVGRGSEIGRAMASDHPKQADPADQEQTLGSAKSLLRERLERDPSHQRPVVPRLQAMNPSVRDDKGPANQRLTAGKYQNDADLSRGQEATGGAA